jgi:hypothetical protein
VQGSHDSWRHPAHGAARRRTVQGLPSVRVPLWRRRARARRRPGSAGWEPANGNPGWSVAAAMGRAHTVERTGQAAAVQGTAEPRDTETVTRGAERGRWKSAHQGNSLAIYSTARPVLRRVGGGNSICLSDRIKNRMEQF